MTHEELVAKYPKILGKVYLEIGEGWYNVIDKLCHWLQFNTDHNSHTGKYPQVVAVQVKEKFGGLRFYVNGASEEQYSVISFVEFFAGSLCEVCGEPGTRRDGDWVQTLCDKHYVPK